MYYLFINGKATRRMPRREDAIRMSAEIVREHPTQTVEITEDGKLPFFETYMTDHGIVSKEWDKLEKLDIKIADLQESLSHCHPREKKVLESMLGDANRESKRARDTYKLGVIAFEGGKKK